MKRNEDRESERMAVETQRGKVEAITHYKRIGY